MNIAIDVFSCFVGWRKRQPDCSFAAVACDQQYIGKDRIGSHVGIRNVDTRNFPARALKVNCVYYQNSECALHRT